MDGQSFLLQKHDYKNDEIILKVSLLVAHSAKRSIAEPKIKAADVIL